MIASNSLVLDMAEAEKQSAMLYGKVGPSLMMCMTTSLHAVGESNPASPKLPPTTPSIWLNPLYSHVQKMTSDSEAFYRFVKETVTVQLDRIKDDLKKRGKEVKLRLGEAQTKLERLHEELQAAIAAHEAAWRLRLRIGSGDEGVLDEVLGTADLYMTEQGLRQRIVAFLEGKECFGGTLMDCFRQSRLLEQELANATKELLGETLRVRGQQYAAAVESITEGLTRMQTTEPLMEWRRALGEHKLDWDWQMELLPLDGFIASVFSQIGCSLSNSNEQLTSTTRSVRIVKSGFLLRPSTFSRSYTVMFCILTDSSYLHCFAPGEAKPHLQSHGGPVSPRPLRVPTASMQLHFKALAELNYQACQAWIDEQSGCLASSLSRPLLSIPLLHPETKVFPNNSEGVYSFTVVVPRGSSFFSRSERKHVMRSFLEEDMVEWCIALKEAIPASASPNPSVATHSPSASASSAGRTPLGSQPGLSPFDQASGEAKDVLAPTIPDDYDDAFRHRYAQDQVEGEPAVRPATPATPLQELENPWDQE